MAEEKPANSDISASRQRSLDNLRPFDREKARELGRKSGEARREKRRKAEELALRDLLPLSLRVQEKAMRGFLERNEDANPALRAADSVQDREWGKATQRVETTVEEAGVQKAREQLASMSTEELRAFMLARTREIQG